jgi:uncharacterized protein YjiS (DUF1127 family)
LYLYNIYVIRNAALQHNGFTIRAAVPHADGRHRSAARPGPAGKETTMLNLAFALIPGLDAAGRGAPPAETDEGFLGKLALRARARVRYHLRYHQALRQLRRLDDRDLDDLDVARADFPELARRHAGTAG